MQKRETKLKKKNNVGVLIRTSKVTNVQSIEFIPLCVTEHPCPNVGHFESAIQKIPINRQKSKEREKNDTKTKHNQNRSFGSFVIVKLTFDLR